MPRLHVVTNDAVLARPDFGLAAVELLEHGTSDLAFHLRGKMTPAALLQGHAEALVPIAKQSGAHLIVNDRLDIALATGAGGVHLGEHAMSSERARSFLGRDLLLGRSVHGVPGAAAAGEGTDYVFLGTIFRSRSHPAATALGLDILAEAVAKSRVAVHAIGGIRVDRIADVMATGARGVAMISAIWDAPDRRVALLQAIQALRDHSVERG